MAFSDYLAQTFPGVRITSSKRDPNSTLGRANPKSWHNVGKAWDTAPVKGLSFDEYVDRIKRDGWDVLEALDEVNNPSPHATGPHWHVAVGDRKEPQVNNLASLMSGIYPMANQQQQQQPTGLAELLDQGSLAPSIPGMTQQDVTPASLPKPGAFAKGGKGWQIMGIIGDALQAAGGGRPTYAPAMMERQQLETEGRQRLQQLMAQRETKEADRAADLQTWKIKQDYTRENPSAPSDAGLLEWWESLPAERKASYAAMKDVQSPIAVSGPGGTFRVPRQLEQQGGGDLRAQAEAAISGGADPAAVWARYRQMGGQ